MIVDGHVECWGENSNGELGDGTRESSASPVPVSGITDAIEVAAGANSSCALLSTNEINCWGLDGQGQLGDGTTEESLTPVPVSEITDATAVAAGNSFACAILISGEVKCWGDNRYGRLEGGYTDVPVQVTGVEDATAISASDHEACAVVEAGHVDCWSENDKGSGVGIAWEGLPPEQVSGISDATSVTVGEGYACARLLSGQIDCWGNETGHVGEPESSIPLAVSGIADAATVSAATIDHTCAVLSGGGVECWGVDPFGQLGNGSLEDSFVPVAVRGLPGPALSVGGGYFFSCAPLSSGGIDCWGENVQDELGNGTTEGSLVPIPVLGIG